jgi:hypothetical protein
MIKVLANGIKEYVPLMGLGDILKDSWPDPYKYVWVSYVITIIGLGASHVVVGQLLHVGLSTQADGSVTMGGGIAEVALLYGLTTYLMRFEKWLRENISLSTAMVLLGLTLVLQAVLAIAAFYTMSKVLIAILAAISVLDGLFWLVFSRHSSDHRDRLEEHTRMRIKDTATRMHPDAEVVASLIVFAVASLSPSAGVWFMAVGSLATAWWVMFPYRKIWEESI